MAKIGLLSKLLDKVFFIRREGRRKEREEKEKEKERRRHHWGEKREGKERERRLLPFFVVQKEIFVQFEVQKPKCERVFKKSTNKHLTKIR